MARFEPGHTINPGGKVAGVFSDEALKLIASDYLAMPRSELMAIYKSEERMDQLSTAHAMVVTRVVASLEKDGRLDFDCVIDRLIGKPAQTSQVNVNLTDRRAVISAILDAARSLGAGQNDGRTIEHNPIGIEKARTAKAK